MHAFKLVRVIMASGWPAGHVAIDRYHQNHNLVGGGEMLLTADAESASELSSYIDELIAELEEIRAEAPRRFAAWKEQYEKKS